MGSRTDCYLQLDGVRGECRDARHGGWIDVLHWSNAIEQPSSLHTGGGGGTGRARFDVLTFIHTVDISTPALFRHCVSGTHIPLLTLVSHKAGGGVQPSTTIKLEDCMITHVAVIGDPALGTIEEVGVAYGKIEMEVREQNPDGSMGAGVMGICDVKQNSVG